MAKPEKFSRFRQPLNPETNDPFDEDYLEEVHDEALELIEEGKYKEAIKEFEKIVNYEFDPYYQDSFVDWFEDALYHEFDAYSELGEHKVALDYINGLLEFDPNDTDYLLGKGYVLEDLKLHKEALECYKKILKIVPDDYDAFVNMSNSLINLKQPEEALKATQKAIKINSKYDDAWFNQGEALLQLGKYQDALESFNMVLEIQRKDHETWYMKARCLAKIGSKENEAIDSLLVAIALEPKNKSKAEKEKDFSTLRSSPNFKRIVK